MEEQEEEEDEDDRGSIDQDDRWHPPPKAIWDVVMEVGTRLFPEWKMFEMS